MPAEVTGGRGRRRARALAVAAGAVVIMGCGGPSGSPPHHDDVSSDAPPMVAEDAGKGSDAESTERTPEAAELMGAWLLEDLGGLGVLNEVQTTIEFEAEGRIFGSGGCNRFTGSYTFEDGQLGFSPLAGTKMMCPEPVMIQEDAFHRALGSVRRVTVAGPDLLFYAEETDAPLRFTRMEAAAGD